MNIPAPLRHWLVAPVAVATLGLTGCGSNVAADDTSSGDAGAGYPVTLTNCGREVVVEKAPQRVVGMMPSQTELLVRLGLADRLVGQAQTATHPLPEDVAAEVADVPEISTDTPPAREDLLKVQPDAVVAPTTYEFTAEQGFATIEQLEQAGAATYVATGGCFDRRATAEVDDLLTDIDNLGRIFGAAAEAEELGQESEARLAAVDEAIAGAEKPTVAQLYVEGNSVSAIGAGVEYDIIKRAGGDNVFRPDEKLFAEFFAATISPEEVAARNPDVIVFAVTDNAHEKQVRDYLARTFQTVTAVSEDRLVAIPASDLYPGTLGNVTAVETISAALYPDRF
jgi:iron complex transport system substrate-binding protein